MSLHTTKRKTATKYKLSQRKTPIKNWMNQGHLATQIHRLRHMLVDFPLMEVHAI